MATVYVGNRAEMFAKSKEITAGGTTAYGVGNTYPEDWTIIDYPFERTIQRNQDGRRTGEYYSIRVGTQPEWEPAPSDPVEAPARDTLTIESVDVERIADNDPDLSWLDQTDDQMGDGFEDQAAARKADYGRAWATIGIRAVATVRVVPGIGSPTRHALQTITSGGLWGIEDDSDAAYLEEIEREQLAELRVTLVAFGVSPDDPLLPADEEPTPEPDPATIRASLVASSGTHDRLRAVCGGEHEEPDPADTIIDGLPKAKRITGKTFVIGADRQNRAICLCTLRDVDSTVLRLMYHETDRLHLARPIQVYGYCCLVGDDHAGSTFRFHQLPAALPPISGADHPTSMSDLDAAVSWLVEAMDYSASAGYDTAATRYVCDDLADRLGSDVAREVWYRACEQVGYQPTPERTASMSDADIMSRPESEPADATMPALATEGPQDEPFRRSEIDQMHRTIEAMAGWIDQLMARMHAAERRLATLDNA